MGKFVNPQLFQLFLAQLFVVVFVGGEIIGCILIAEIELTVFSNEGLAVERERGRMVGGGMVV